MKSKSNSKLLFFIEHALRDTDSGRNINHAMAEIGIRSEEHLDENRLNIIFSTSSKNKTFTKLKNKICITCNETDFNSPADLLGILDSILKADWWSMLNLKLRESEKKLDQIKLKNLSSERSVVSKLQHELELILEMELLLLREAEIDKWNVLIKNFYKRNHLFSTILLANEKELFTDDSALDSHTLIYQLPLGSMFLVVKDKNITNLEDELKLEFLILVINRALQVIDQQENKDVGEIDFWKNIFSKIPHPMAVISPLGELLIYNEHFASVGILPKECLGFKDNDHLELHQQYYKIRRFDFSFHGNSIHYYIFYTSEKIMNNPNNELGIVSSSIAHELNNPLAGILAALALVRLENEWSEEAVLEIEEMKNGAKRCKELVEIFLGFSRLAPNNSGDTSLKLSLDQAINLLRFRMVESDLRLDVKLSSMNENLNFEINSSVLSMILYLILSELMTAFAHHRLLFPKSLSLLEGKVVGSTQQLQFILNEEFEYEKNILDSKLLQHLLFFEKLQIVFHKKEIRLIKNYK